MFITVTSKDTGGTVIANTQHIVGVVDDEGTVYLKMIGNDPAFKIVESISEVKFLLNLK